MSDCLVLNPFYEPIHQVSWQRALALTVNPLVEVLEEYDDWTVATVRKVYAVPAVLRFLEGARGRKKGVRFSRDNVYARDHGQCQYCGHKVARQEMTLDHVLPRDLGGQTKWTNVVVCCLGCNQRKANRTLDQVRMRLLSQPVRPASVAGQIRLTFPKGVLPDQWRSYIRSASYWNAALAEE